MSTPKFDSAASSTIVHSAVRTAHDISVADALTWVMPRVAWRAT
jgi:hypothetical protein